MAKRPLLTALIPAGQSEAVLADCLDSVAFAEEVYVVVDDSSSDATASIARKKGARVELHPYPYSAAQKNWAIPRCTHPWILLLDTDERVPLPLAKEIQKLLEEGPQFQAYWIYRRNFLLGHPLRHGQWGADKCIRLFQRDTCCYEDKRVHAEIQSPPSNTGFLQEKMDHLAIPALGPYLPKMTRYGRWAAEEMHRRGHHFHFWDLWIRPWAAWFKAYILRGGLLDGIPGIVAAVLHGYGTFLKYMMLWEIEEEEKGYSSKPR